MKFNVELSLLLILNLCVLKTVKCHDTPIIGVLTQELLLEHKDENDRLSNQSFIAASYVRFVQISGARVMPVEIKKDPQYYENVIKYTNGLLLPGGWAPLGDSEYTRAAYLMLDAAMKANQEGDYYPVWGVCLGCEVMADYFANKTVIVTKCGSMDATMPLKFVVTNYRNTMFEHASRDLMRVS